MQCLCVCEWEGEIVKWFAGPTEGLEVRDLENEGVKQRKAEWLLTEFLLRVKQSTLSLVLHLKLPLCVCVCV